MDAYAPEIERVMKRLFDSLGENDRRRYAAVEATKLGHGGIEYIARLLGCDPKTIRQGQSELEGTDDSGQRASPKKRGGRKRLIELDSTLERELLEGASGPHRGRSDESRGEVDEPVSATDRGADDRVGHSGRS